MIDKKTFVKGNRKILNAWAFYDWANSVYSLVISSAIFPIFYGALFRMNHTETYAVFSMNLRSESIISYITAFGFFIVALISPVLSGVADFLGNKKFFMKLFCFIGSFSCMMLYFFEFEQLFIGLFFYTLALIGFWSSLVFYNSYLPDIAFKEQQDKISAKGFTLGYLGSVLLLILNLVLLLNFKFFGFESELQAMRISFVMVGLWWLGFSFVSFKFLPDFRNQNKFSTHIFFDGWKKLKKVWQQLKEHKTLKRFLIAFFVYSMAVQTVMIIATYFAEKEIAWESDSQRTFGLIISILLIQIIAAFGALVTAIVCKKIGNINTLMAINLLWIFICIYAYFIKSPMEFYITASFVGLVMGGIQTLSRSTYSKLLPVTVETTSFFSFFDITEKIGIVLGMSMYGLVTQLTGKVQNAILFLVLFFAVGLYLLNRVKKTFKNSN